MALAGRGKVNLVKYAQTIFYNKELLARGNDFIGAISPKRRIAGGGMSEGHSAGTQAY